MNKPQIKQLLYVILLVITISTASAVSLDELLSSYDWGFVQGDINVTSYAEFGLNSTGGPALNDLLVVNLSVSSPAGGTFLFIGELYENNEFITSTETTQAVPSGPSTVQINFPSQTLDDGIYNLTVKILSTDNQLLFSEKDAHTIDYDSTDYEKPPVTILSITDNPLSTDVDPKYELLQLNLTLNTTNSSNYQITAYLTDDKGSIIIDQENFNLALGEETITMNIESTKLWDQRVTDGTYNLDLVTIKNTFEKKYKPAYTTASYNLSDFDPEKSIVLNQHTYSLVDLNSNSLADYLEINLTLNINESGIYTIEASLDDLHNNHIADIEGNYSLGTGNLIANIQISGKEIYKTKINGPYKLSFVKLIKNNQVIDYVENTLTTNATNYDEFEKPIMPDLTINNQEIIVIDKSEFAPGLIDLEIKVNNIGLKPAFGTSVSVFNDNSELLNEQSIPIISQNETILIQRLNISGSEKVHVYADIEDEIEELNESNNIATIQFTLASTLNAAPTSGTATLLVNFDAIATGIFPLTYEWDFNNDSIIDSTEKNTQYKYTQGGNYTVTLNVTDGFGISIIKNTVISVTPGIPVTSGITASAYRAVVPARIYFNGTGTGDAPLTYKWDFNNDELFDKVEQNTYFDFLTGENYTVNLLVLDAQEDASLTQTQIEIMNNSQPTANALADQMNGIDPLTVQFTGTVTEGNLPLTFKWDFNDGTDSTAQNPQHTYSAGDYTANFTVTDFDGETSTTLIPITVEIDLQPTATIDLINPTWGYIPLTVDFTGSASSGNPPLTYEWDINGDSIVDYTGLSIQHTYTTKDFYTVHFIVTDVDGDTSTAEDFVAVENQQSLDFTITADDTSGTRPLTVQFGAVVNAGDPPITFEWDFTNDGTTDSVIQNPSHTFTQAGSYTTKLTARDDSGDVVSETKSITVYPQVDLTIDRVDVSRVKPPIAGGLTLIRFVLTNNGQDPINNIGYTINTGSSDTNPVYNIPDLPGSTTMKVWSSWIYASAGTYSANLILDPQDNIPETNEGNNEKQFSVQVS